MEELIASLDWLQEIDRETLGELFEVTTKYMKAEIDRRFLTRVASKLEKEVEEIELTIEGIGYIISNLATGGVGIELP